MSKEAFAKNLTAAVSQSEFTPRQLAQQVKMRPETLWRWMTNGVERVNGSSREKLAALCEKLEVDPQSLWLANTSRADEGADKIREVVQIWEEFGLDVGWIDWTHLATVAVHRLWVDEPHLWQRLRDRLGKATDTELMLELYNRAWEALNEKQLDEEQLYSELYELATSRWS